MKLLLRYSRGVSHTNSKTVVTACTKTHINENHRKSQPGRGVGHE